MVLDLGPCPADEALSWSRFARRIVVELRSSHRVDDGWNATTDLLDSWSQTIDAWSEAADRCRDADQPFRWTSDLAPELAEFLLAGLDRGLHSSTVRGLCTDDEISRQMPFTVMVVRSFIDGLASEGDGCQQYADQVLTSLQDVLPG